MSDRQGWNGSGVAPSHRTYATYTIIKITLEIGSINKNWIEKWTSRGLNNSVSNVITHFIVPFGIVEIRSVTLSKTILFSQVLFYGFHVFLSITSVFIASSRFVSLTPGMKTRNYSKVEISGNVQNELNKILLLQSYYMPVYVSWKVINFLVLSFISFWTVFVFVIDKVV